MSVPFSASISFLLCRNMEVAFYNIPTIVMLCVVVSMMVAIFQFDHLRGTALKDWLIRLWPVDRRRVLHLEKQNGFYFLIDRFIDWSDSIVRLIWIPALLAFAGGTCAAFFAAFLVSLGFLIRYGSLLYLAGIRIARFTIPLDDDGFGVYARSAADWRQFKRSMLFPWL